MTDETREIENKDTEDQRKIMRVKCLSCHKKVDVRLNPRGGSGGYIAVCPICRGLAYNKLADNSLPYETTRPNGNR
jgi:hypothetical protein